LICCCSRKFGASKFITYVMHSVYFKFCINTRRADNFMDGKNVCVGNAVSAVRHPTCVPLFRNVVTAVWDMTSVLIFGNAVMIVKMTSHESVEIWQFCNDRMRSHKSAAIWQCCNDRSVISHDSATIWQCCNDRQHDTPWFWNNLAML